MNSFIDYYAILGIEANASPETIKTAFKKLALQYHPDVYKGEDAHERMQVLLEAYQTLSNPTERKTYDFRHAEHVGNDRSQYTRSASQSASQRGSKGNVTPLARRDRQRAYDFTDLKEGYSAQITLGDISYSLSSQETHALREDGLLRGVANVGGQYINPAEIERNSASAHLSFYCHRCHHRWSPTTGRNRAVSMQNSYCPSCNASDWTEYLLLRCIHCCAIFESEQIRYEIGSYNYGDGSLCPPYELFPLCPYCGTAGWCPAENKRVELLRAQAARRATFTRWLWVGLAIAGVLGILLLFTILR